MEKKRKRAVQKRTLENKEKLINSADKLFKEKGFYNTNSKEIANNAGVSTGVFYNYFKDKIGVFLEIFQGDCDYSYNLLKELIHKVLLNNKASNEIFTEYLHIGIDSLYRSGHIYEEIDSLKKEYTEVEIIFQNHNKRVKKLLKPFFESANKSKPLVNFELKYDILINTLKGNASAITRIEDEKYRNEYVDGLIDMIYKFAVENAKQNPVTKDKLR